MRNNRKKKAVLKDAKTKGVLGALQSCIWCLGLSGYLLGSTLLYIHLMGRKKKNRKSIQYNHHENQDQKQAQETREMAQHLRALTALGSTWVCLKPSIASVLGDLMPLSCPWRHGTHMLCLHTCRRNIHTHKIKSSLLSEAEETRSLTGRHFRMGSPQPSTFWDKLPTCWPCCTVWPAL